MLPQNPTSYDDLLARFSWDIPARFNIGVACSNWVATKSPNREAIIDFSGDTPAILTFAQLAQKSTDFAAALTKLGVKRGDRIAVMQPQSHYAAIVHLGTYKVGGIVVPLATQFGPEAILHRLKTAGATVFVSDASGIARFHEIKHQLAEKIIVISTDVQSPENTQNFQDLLDGSYPDFNPVDTNPDDPAMMLFTSGTTGQPKGALHGHRVLLGHLPGIQAAHGFLPHDGDVFWTPSDWAWAGGLLNALLPSLYLGVPVVAARAKKFEADWAIDLIKRAGIRNIFMPPTALKLMQAHLSSDEKLDVRSIACAGEALGKQTLKWAEQTLGMKINEFYGQTECNAIIGACHEIGVWKSGSMGKAVPGHTITILDEQGQAVPSGTVGEIAVHKSSPVIFTEYLNNEDATKAKFKGDWLLTGDRATCDEDGYFHFQGRNDDIITSAGYRIGPTEIEDCLTGHPAVQLAAVVGLPDEKRTEIVSAFIKLKASAIGTDTLKTEICDFVKSKLSAHEYPRRITFVDEIPLTESGKVIRRHFKAQKSPPA